MPQHISSFGVQVTACSLHICAFAQQGLCCHRLLMKPPLRSTLSLVAEYTICSTHNAAPAHQLCDVTIVHVLSL